MTDEATKKKRILIVSDAWHPQINGVVRTYEHLVTEIEKLGHMIKVIGPGDMPRTKALSFYPEIQLTLPPYDTLYKAIEDFAPGSLHLATEGPLGWAARRYARKRGIRFSTAYHTQFPAYVASRMNGVWKALSPVAFEIAEFIMRRFHAPAAITVTTTRAINQELRERGYKGRLAALPRGVPMDIFHPGPATLFTELKRPVALYVGRIAVEKNVEEFLAMEWAGSKVVIGDGPQLATLQAKYPDVQFTGPKSGTELADCYRSADVFAFPSRTDTFGIVIIEALACGLPVAAHRVPGPYDIIAKDFLGVLDDDLGKAAAAAVALPEGGLQRAGYVATHFTWPVIAKHFLKILERAGV